MKTHFKNLMTFFLILTISLVIMYIGFSFIKENINPFSWSESERLVMIWISFIISIILLMGILQFDDNENGK